MPLPKEQQTMLDEATSNIFVSDQHVMEMCNMANIKVAMFICSQVQEEFSAHYGITICHNNGE